MEPIKNELNVFMKKTGRNDPCPCGSGKKFKKCCESKMIGGRFMATKVDTASSAPIQKTASLTSLFHARLAETPKKPMPPAPEEAKDALVQTSS
jgi:hypothetical protein